MQRVIERFRSAKTFPEIFGSLGGDIQTQLDSLDHAYKQAVKQVHPDHVPEEERGEAGEAFKLLTELKNKAGVAIKANRYDKPFTPLGMSTTQIHSKKQVYIVPDSYTWKGQYSAIYIAQQESNGTLVLMKIALNAQQNTRLEREERVTRKLISRSVPFVAAPLDSFVIRNGATGLRATVWPYDPEMLSLTDIRNRMGKPLEHRDAAWIWRRIAGQVMAAKMARRVHGAIVPDHVLVHPIKHNVQHIGWVQSVHPGRCITNPLAEWCAPEMLIDDPVDERCDVYMAGQTMLYLIDREIEYLPPRIASVLRWATAQSPDERPSGRELLETLTETIRKEWGKQYRKLTFPR